MSINVQHVDKAFKRFMDVISEEKLTPNEIRDLSFKFSDYGRMRELQAEFGVSA
jgi:hypothetical protein